MGENALVENDEIRLGREYPRHAVPELVPAYA
jgi:hypothetical protein